MQELLAFSRGWKQGRCRLAPQRCLTCGRQIVEDIAVLLLERRHDSHHRFHEPGPLWTVGPKTPLAPEDAGPYRSFRRVIGGLYLRVPHEGPQGLTPLEDLPAGAFGLGAPTGLARLQQPLHLPSDWLHVGPQAGRRQRTIPDTVPPMKHLAGLDAQGLADLGRAPTPRDHRFNVPQQMRPTELPAPRGVPGVSTPAVRHQPAP